jgi:hypothetical protein
MKEQVLQWLSSGCDYTHGLALLSQTGKHKNLIHSITGRPNRYAEKLKYELMKAAGLNNLLKPVEEENPAEKLPVIVERVIREHSETFLLRSRLHEQLRALPEDNSGETVKNRKNLSDTISHLSSRIDLLFAAKEAFYTEGRMPDADILFPQPPSHSSEEEPCDSARPLTRASDTLPTTPQELKKLKKNLQTSNTKDQNLLEYQDISKADKPNPMPSGPKKLKLENRIKTRLAQIEQIDYKLLKT